MSRALSLSIVVAALVSTQALAQESEYVDPYAAVAPQVEPVRAPHPVTTTTVTTTTMATAQVSKLGELDLGSRAWAEGARFFGGVRMGMGVPPRGRGVAPTAGFELGVAADAGIGFGLHLLTVANPPDAPSLGIPKAQWGLGAAADLRWYFQTVEPLTLYPTFSVGFLAGPGEDGTNAVLPTLNPGFGARVRLGNVYTSFEFGVAAFQVPFVTIGFGWEPTRYARRG